MHGGALGGYLDAWIDFNANGIWELTEQVFNAESLSPGRNKLTVAVPSSITPGGTYARFRLSDVGGLTPFGDPADGEVEDYRVRLFSLPSASGVEITDLSIAYSGAVARVEWAADTNTVYQL